MVIVFMTKKPGIPEEDFAGVIVGGDLSGSNFKVGDEVFGAVPVSLRRKKGASRILGSLSYVTR